SDTEQITVDWNPKCGKCSTVQLSQLVVGLNCVSQLAWKPNGRLVGTAAPASATAPRAPSARTRRNATPMSPAKTITGPHASHAAPTWARATTPVPSSVFQARKSSLFSICVAPVLLRGVEFHSEIKCSRPQVGNEDAALIIGHRSGTDGSHKRWQ